MRAWWLAPTLVLAACHADIASGSYLCGAEASCPEDQVCDETNDVCVSPISKLPFSCNGSDREPDNDPTTATQVGALTCVSTSTTLSSCLEGGDALDVVTLTTPAGCATVAVHAELDFSEAYEELKVTLTAADGTTVVAMDTTCPNQVSDDGQTSRCLSAPVADSTTYALRVEPTGEGTCGGDCAFNRYRLNVRLSP